MCTSHTHRHALITLLGLGGSEKSSSEISKCMSILNDTFDYFHVGNRFLFFNDERNELNYPNAFNNAAE